MRTLSRTAPANQGGDAVTTRPPGTVQPCAPPARSGLPFRASRLSPSVRPEGHDPVNPGFSLPETGFRSDPTHRHLELTMLATLS